MRYESQPDESMTLSSALSCSLMSLPFSLSREVVVKVPRLFCGALKARVVDASTAFRHLCHEFQLLAARTNALRVGIAASLDDTRALVQQHVIALIFTNYQPRHERSRIAVHMVNDHAFGAVVFPMRPRRECDAHGDRQTADSSESDLGYGGCRHTSANNSVVLGMWDETAFHKSDSVV
jgi:hypothetical protein